MQKILIDKLTLPVMVECESDEFLCFFHSQQYIYVLRSFEQFLHSSHTWGNGLPYHTGEKNKKYIKIICKILLQKSFEVLKLVYTCIWKIHHEHVHD